MSPSSGWNRGLTGFIFGNIIPNMETAQDTIKADVIGIFRPLVRLLLRHGVSYEAFTVLAKREYVDVAMNDFGIHVVDERRAGRPSEEATLSGLPSGGERKGQGNSRE